MTDTKTPSPSDAELLEVAGLAPNRKVCASTCMTSRFDKKPCECYPGMRKDEAIKFARAVLARWGAQPAVEPVGVITGKLSDLCQFRSTTMRKGDAVYAAPQPAPVREPLTDGQIDAALSSVRPDWWDTPSAATYDFARAIERAHGITANSENGGGNAD